MSQVSGSDAPATSSRRPRRWFLWGVLLVALALVAVVAWVSIRGLLAKRDLEDSVAHVTALRAQLESGDVSGARRTAVQLEQSAAGARSMTDDVVWRSMEVVPFVGDNLRAVRQVAGVVDDVARHAVRPVAAMIGDLNADSFAPRDGALDLKPLQDAQAPVRQATAALHRAEDDARGIDTSGTVSAVTGGVDRLRAALAAIAPQADAADDVVQLAPTMLGRDGARRYLILFQNNSELRAGGGIPGALAEVEVDDGAIRLERQASSSDFPETAQPVLPLDQDTEGLYGAITGRYVQDVTLTPRFETSATLAREMWKQRFGYEVDGVLAIDPVTLSYLLRATGPLQLPTGDELTSDNAVPLLLNEAYTKYPDPVAQDAFFASAAAAVFSKVSAGDFDPAVFVQALTAGVDEDRVKLWSADEREQERLAGTAVGGQLPVSDARNQRFGVYLNDSTGAKMDYYLEKKVSVGSSVCRRDGRPTSVVEVTLRNNAPADVAESEPAYVTGGGSFGVPPGEVGTIIGVYAPPGSIYLSSALDSTEPAVLTAMDGAHSVVQVRTQLAPGESTTFRVAFLGEARQAKAAVDASVTPGIRHDEVQPAAVDCRDPAKP